MGEESLSEVVEKMMKAGWVLGFAEDTQGVGLRWTDKGSRISSILGDAFKELGDDLSAEELAWLITIIERLSPGGTNPPIR